MPETFNLFNEKATVLQFYCDGRYDTEKEAYEAAKAICLLYDCKCLVGTIDKVVEIKFETTIV